jgi:DNA helicase HerA-like ATPase
MYNDDRIHMMDRASGDGSSAADHSNTSASPAAAPIARVVAVSGSHVIAEFLPGYEGAGVTVGSLLGIANGASLAIGTLCDMSVERSGEGSGSIVGRIDLLGEITVASSGERRFQAGIGAYPKIGNAIAPAGADELQVIFGFANPNTIAVGHLQQDAAIAATVNIEELVRKHFAIVGSTGSGKSSALALILRKIMAARSDLRMLLIDAHNEYAECFDDRARIFGPDNLNLPFWLFNFDEIVQLVFGARSLAEREVALLAELIPLAKTEYARARSILRSSYRGGQSDGGRFTVDTPVPYRFEDLIAAAESRMGKLENADLAVQYQRLLMRINAVRKNPRYGFIFEDSSGANDTMVEILSDLLRLNDEQQPVAVVQLAGFPAETMELIVSVLFRLAFDFGVWSDGRSPLLIVCEEAHNYANADHAVGFRSAREGLSRIAKEGRKHGVFLGLVTQRPHQLDPTLISQCSTVFAMRLGHEDDQKIVRAAVSDSASRQLAFLPALGTREALVIGAGVPTVMRLRFEELPEASIPNSQSAWGGELDAASQVDEEMVAEVVARWRGTVTGSKIAPQPMPPELQRRAEEAMSWPPPMAGSLGADLRRR